MKSDKTCAVILAAGSGSRMNLPVTKQRITVLGKTVLLRTLLAFERCVDVDSIVVVCRADEVDFVKSEIAKGITKVTSVVVGGKVRAESAAIGFFALPKDTEIVAIHDGARCLITPDMISKVINDAKTHGAATAATYLTDTVKTVNEKGLVVATNDRRFTVTVQTPQVFKTDIYKKALSGVDVTDSNITDDNMLVEKIGVSVFCSDIGKTNIKITHNSDILYAEYIIKEEGLDV